MNLPPLSIALQLFLFFRFSIADVSINCGSAGTSAASNGRQWLGDSLPNSLLQLNGVSTTSTALSSADPVPHSTARISRSQFSYAIRVNPGQIIIRLHFNPSQYKGFKGLKDLFGVEAAPFTLLSNFSAAALGVNTFAKEFCLNIHENQQLTITFSPEISQSQDTYAFVNGIEIISVPAALSYFDAGDMGLQELRQNSLLYVDCNTALEIVHRQNIRHDLVMSTPDYDDMFLKWETQETDEIKNTTWRIPVEVGFRYLIRLHFSKLGHKFAGSGDLVFKVLINGMIAHTNTDILKARGEDNAVLYKDYLVMMRGLKRDGKRDLSISLQSHDALIDVYGVLAGFEVAKLSNHDNSLASPNPLPPPQDSSSWTIQILLRVLGPKNVIAAIVVAIISLLSVIVHMSREIWEANDTEEEEEHKPSARAKRHCRCFSLVEIQVATKNFSDGLLIGRGGFGKVYKGFIDKGKMTVAIKRLKSDSHQGAHEFLTEVETLSELRHMNLVSLIGYCREKGEMILVYEYMPNGTLADHLYKHERNDHDSSPLTWKQRLNICIGAGRGLDYIHTGHRIIHRDVKASNILLDETFVAKVSDFGLAKPEDRSKLQSHVSTKVKGTRGYLDAHYINTSRVTRKSDVYAFGVVLLEVLCGRPPLDWGVPENEQILTMWARDKFNKGEVDQIVASTLREEILPDSLKTFVGIAERCLHDEPKNRPTMSQIVQQLEDALEQQDKPQPLVLNERTSNASDETEQSELQNLTNPPEEKSHSKLVSSELPRGKKVVRKGTTHKQSILGTWWAFWNRATTTKENELLLSGPRTSTLPLSSTQTANYGISSEELVSMSREHDISLLQQKGGVKGVAENLKSNLEKGVSGDESDLINRKTAFGSNTYPRKEGRSFWRFVWDACRDTTLIILMVAAAASLALGIKTEGIKEGWYDGGSIALAVIIVIIFTAVSDYKQSLQFQDLNEEKQNIQIEVIRGGRRIKISIFEIVVGDVLPLKIGDQVPADGLVISSHSLSIDESSMTGESKIVHKDSVRAPFLMSGCKVADGYGTMLVTSVGLNTEWGLLMASISEDNGEETPLQVRLNGVATFIGMVGLAVAVVVLIVLVIRFFTGNTKDPDGTVQFIAGKTKIGDAIDGFVKIFTVAVTIVVVAVPEGLPLAVTLTLAYSMRKMMADKALVRRLSACETMGSATTICSDKTGTLTLNQMTVVEVCACGKKIDLPDNKSQLPPMVSSLLIEGIAQNTTGSVFAAEGGGALELSGSPTEKAILQWGIKLGMDFEAVRSDSVIIHAFPFNSEKKRGGVALKLSDSEIHVHWKGAAELVLACCTAYLDEDSNVVPMDEDKLSYFKKAIEDMAAGSLRCVAIAYRPYEIEKVPSTDEELENWQLPETDLILLAIVGIKDPCRSGVREAVQLCTNAGVKVRMVTGDNLQTARAIALECGILHSNVDATEPNIIEGRTFRNFTELQRLDVAEKISVMGRSSPNDKLLLVQALRKRGHVVAVTGDGTNDAPALHEADIGLSMGIQGTEVAKESSDIIILDDNFASVVKVVRWGRSVYANIQKFIQFQLTVNVAALIINVVAAVSSGHVPLNAVQLLWVNLIMDTLGALALATEPPTDHLMHRPPVGRREPLITNIMWRNLLIQALYQVTVLLVLNFRGNSILNLEQDETDHAFKVKNTLIFNAFVFCQVFNEFNARKPDEINVWKGITKSHLFVGIVALEVVLQVIIIFFLGKFASTVRLSWKLWLVSIAIGIISWPLAVVGKLIPVPERPFSESLKRKVRRQRNTDGQER